MKRVTYLNLTDFSTYETFVWGGKVTDMRGYKIIEVA